MCTSIVQFGNTVQQIKIKGSFVFGKRSLVIGGGGVGKQTSGQCNPWQYDDRVKQFKNTKKQSGNELWPLKTNQAMVSQDWVTNYFEKKKVKLKTKQQQQKSNFVNR